MKDLLKQIIDSIPYPLGIVDTRGDIILNPEALSHMGQIEIPQWQQMLANRITTFEVITSSRRLVAVRSVPLTGREALLVFEEPDQADIPRDELTNLMTRHHLHSIGEIILRGTSPDRKTAILFLDLDGFKLVNDTLGHDAGDEVLVEVARRMTSAIRSVDLCFRWGGDEFVIITQGLTEKIHSGLIARRIINAITRPLVVKKREARLGVSIGIAVAPDDGSDIDELLRKADKAMYEAKKSGGNTYAFTVE
ncbi:GGDEF domain-containing protein [Thermodesulforhabdus norvegica]|uniref:Diguanylate cyclase (GGDEF) domain-containing protein n=1 Tax=Thermodesulforhabdus norvegica TaxID=39841 RepID=A0A1I4RCJ1_9BACT|nr:GGDEF domain-containing protein [Thermodesulforhabdus norvegica]SFM49680.1 diguanylate cyclase (GGDEF) domain-containing protein [Thermodesulforhabdus norvegica]